MIGLFLLLSYVQQQVDPAQFLPPKGIGVVRCETVGLGSELRERGAFGFEVLVRGGSPIWLAGVTSGDVVVRLQGKYLGDGLPAAHFTFARDLSALTNAGKDVSMTIERDKEGVRDMIFFVTVKPIENLADFTNIGGGSTKISAGAAPLSNYIRGGIGLLAMTAAKDSSTSQSGGPVTVTVMSFSPAWVSGLRDGDQIIKVDELDLAAAASPGEAVLSLREHLINAASDAKIKLEVNRPGAAPLTLEVTKKAGIIDRQYPPRS